MTDFYNEIDPYAAQWLRNLIAAGHIPPGVVDERSITELDPQELKAYTQCHFFAGIGVWAYALRRAGWPNDRPVWTGSCPCQPFSNAGKRKGHADERHLWPAWERLIRECRPDSILGEQVSGPDGLAWLDLVCTDLEDRGYAVGAIVATAAGVGAPHGRHRIYFVANAGSCERGGPGALAYAGGAGAPRLTGVSWPGPSPEAGVWGGSGGSGGLDDAGGLGRAARRGDDHEHDGILAPAAGGALGLGDAQRQRSPRSCDPGVGQGVGYARAQPARAGADGAPDGMDHTTEPGLALWGHDQVARGALGQEGSAAGGPGPVNGFWADAEWVLCRDPQGPRWRPIEPGSFPVVDGASSRVGRLRAFGNGLCAETAVNFIRSVMP